MMMHRSIDCATRAIQSNIAFFNEREKP